VDNPPGAASGPDGADRRADATGGRLDAVIVRRWILELDRRLRASEAHLTELDAAIGDADHGANMTRGARAAAGPGGRRAGRQRGPARRRGRPHLLPVGRRRQRPAVRHLVQRAGRTLPPTTTPTPRSSRRAGRGTRRGPAARCRRARGQDHGGRAGAGRGAGPGGGPLGADLAGILRLAVGAAEDGALATVPLRARRGRASYLGARSEGHQDPGATSAAIVLDALRQAAGA
jgi:phosphoenolpyruvate---glycerone phosphotransferase subunit DhaL